MARSTDTDWGAGAVNVEKPNDSHDEPIYQGIIEARTLEQLLDVPHCEATHHINGSCTHDVSHSLTVHCLPVTIDVCEGFDNAWFELLSGIDGVPSDTVVCSNCLDVAIHCWTVIRKSH